LAAGLQRLTAQGNGLDTRAQEAQYHHSAAVMCGASDRPTTLSRVSLSGLKPYGLVSAATSSPPPRSGRSSLVCCRVLCAFQQARRAGERRARKADVSRLCPIEARQLSKRLVCSQPVTALEACNRPGENGSGRTGDAALSAIGTRHSAASPEHTCLLPDGQTEPRDSLSAYTLYYILSGGQTEPRDSLSAYTLYYILSDGQTEPRDSLSAYTLYYILSGGQTEPRDKVSATSLVLLGRHRGGLRVTPEGWQLILCALYFTTSYLTVGRHRRSAGGPKEGMGRRPGGGGVFLSRRRCRRCRRCRRR